MTNETLTDLQFVPLHDAHAIEQVLMVLQLTRPISEASFVLVRDKIAQFNTELPGQSPIQRVTFAIGQNPNLVGQPSQSEVRGFVMNRTAPNGVVESELLLQPDAITFRTTTYTRWQSVWEQARKYFEAVAGIYVNENAVASASLSFIDKFVWVGDLSRCTPKILLKPQSPYICPHVYDLQDLWHSHSGAFSRSDAQTKRLLNINVDYLQEELTSGPRRTVSISTVLTDMFNQPGYDQFSVESADMPDFLTARMNNLHEFSKSVFGKVISEEMSKRIALST
jgi:uncharacterized protein (TIGR04255 family)